MTKSDLQTSLRLSENLRDRLAQAAAECGHGIGEEMRRRLEASFKPEPATDVPIDEKTRALVTAIAEMTRTIGIFYEPWHTDRFAFEIIKAAVNTALDYRRPKGEPILKLDPNKHLLDVICHPSDKPDVIGRIVALTQLTGWATGRKP
jgi:hypothetical protein